MRHARVFAVALAGSAVLLAGRPFASQAPAKAPYPPISAFLSPASPQEIVAARSVDRLAWVDYHEGRRNAFAAIGPAFKPIQLTNYTKDDGLMLSDVQISADGSTVTFIRGEEPNRDGWDADPDGDPNGTDRAIWAAKVATPGVSWKVVDTPNGRGGAYELAPDGSSVIFANDGEIYRALTSRMRPTSEMDRGEKPFIDEWGTNSNPTWSPDGRKIAYESNRVDHSLIVIYDMATRSIKYMSPSVDHDANPVWQSDSKHILYIRRPGTPFGQQAQQGGGGIGMPSGPAYNPATAAAGRGGRGGGGGGFGGFAGGGGQGRGGAQNPNIPASAASVPGLMTATFRGGYTLSMWKADVTTGEGREVWHDPPTDRKFANMNNVFWGGDDTVVFELNTGFGRGGGGGRGGPGRGGAGRGGEPPAASTASGEQAAPEAAAPAPAPDEWDRYYSLNVSSPGAVPVLLTTTDGLIEDRTSIKVSADGKTFYYCTNAQDIERRHIWAVPTSGGTPRQVTTGEGVETYPAPLASGKTLATLSASWNMPQSLGVWPTAGGAQRIVFPTSRPGFPVDAHVKPEIVLTKAADGLEIHNQLFLPKDIRPGEKRPAMIFVHGGPVREMMPAYHYMQVYHWFYGVNEWLASQGYIVLSINYRGGIGYGHSFQRAPNTNARGNAEYQDVLAGAKYLQSRPDVDPDRLGIWGLSYGGLLTAEALARNSDIFKVGVDLAGVHLYGSSLNPDDLSYQSSAISHIDDWKSPVLLVQGDDDRNVLFQQMTGLVQLLRARNVDYQLIVLPDDVHESLLYSRWMYIYSQMEPFIHKYLGPPPVEASGKR